MLVSMRRILESARKGGYGVAAPNVFNMETVRAAFESAKELQAPIILNCAGAHPIEEVSELAYFYEKKYPEVIAALNLDHGETFEEAIRAIRAGFTSVMVDRSTLPYEENVAQVKEIVKIARAVGVSVEAELGHVGFGFEYDKTRDSGLTDPKQAVEFVEETGVDCLAVAVGTSHGTYKGDPKLEFELLEEISSKVDVPLVLHGGSGTGDENLQKAVGKGIQKINLFTDLNILGLDFLRQYLVDGNPGSGENLLDVSEGQTNGEFSSDNKTINICDAYEVVSKGYKKALMHYMELFGSKGKA